jgi:hypothetical protein
VKCEHLAVFPSLNPIASRPLPVLPGRQSWSKISRIFFTHKPTLDVRRQGVQKSFITFQVNFLRLIII